MSLPKDDAAVLSARWTEGVLLEARRVFDGRARPLSRAMTARSMRCCAGSIRCRGGRTCSARHLFARERRALALARDLDVGPKLLWAGRQALVRGFIDGVALHLAKPHGDVAYFRSAKAGAAQAASRRHLPQRSRQGTELAARQRRPRLCHRFPARRLLQDAQPAVPDRRLRGSAASAEAQAQLCAGRADAEGAQDSRAQIAVSPASGSRPARKSTAPSPAACSISPIAKVAAGGWSTTRPS